MKFGDHLQKNILHPWKIEYIQYDILKRDLKRRQLDKEWDEEDEANFVQLFSNERNKVEQFITNFNQQLASRIRYARHLLKSGVVKFQTDQQQQQTIEFLNTLDDSLVEIIFDVNDFSKFIFLNKTGFGKILKKHKKWTKIDHDALPWYEYHTIDSVLESNWEISFYTQISLLRYQCRSKFSTRKSVVNNALPDLKNAISTALPEKKVKKYWILPEHISEVIAIISMHCFAVQPLLKKSNPPTESQKPSFDFAMSNVYFENSNFVAYSDRLSDKENAQNIKCKRYGSDSNDFIYFEHDLCNKPYSREIYSKKRFKMDHQILSAYCKGEYKVDIASAPKCVEVMDEKEALKSDHEKESLPESFAKETQDTLVSSNMSPTIQCNYQRVTFQSPPDEDDSSPLTITIDTNISFCTSNSSLTEEQLFLPINDKKYSQKQFKYAVLEIKFPVDIKYDDNSLQWFHSLSQSSSLIHEVPKFSKFVQGVYQLYSVTSAELVLPEWNHIYKDGIPNLVKSGHGLSRSRSLRPLLNGKPFRITIPYSAAGTVNTERSIRKSLQQQQKHSTQVDIEQQSMKKASKTPCHSSTISSDFTAISINNHFTSNDKLNDSKMGLEMNEKIEMNHNRATKQAKPLFFFSVFFNSKKNSNKCILDQDGDPIEYSRQQEKNEKKKVEVIKIEPKAFFANERTFISWLQFCALLLTVALNLLNFGDQVSKICGGIFLFISMLLALYALVRFQYRAWQLRHPNQTGRYDDLYGPAVLCILIVAALVINFCLRYKYITNQESQALFSTSSKLMDNSTTY